MDAVHFVRVLGTPDMLQTSAFVSSMQERSTLLRAIRTQVRDGDGQFRKPIRQHSLAMAPLGPGLGVRGLRRQQRAPLANVV